MLHPSVVCFFKNALQGKRSQDKSTGVERVQGGLTGVRVQLDHWRLGQIQSGKVRLGQMSYGWGLHKVE